MGESNATEISGNESVTIVTCGTSGKSLPSKSGNQKEIVYKAVRSSEINKNRSFCSRGVGGGVCVGTGGECWAVGELTHKGSSCYV